MGRKPREIASSGIYHVIIRGINKQNIFCDKEDREYMLQILLRQQTRQEKVGQQAFNSPENVVKHHAFSLYSYCLMSNHVHLLLRTFKDRLPDIMKRLEDTYVRYFNDKWGRSGPLFQNRYKSEPVEDKQYFVTLIHYINYNPVKAGLTTRATLYMWSSAHELADNLPRKNRVCSINAILKAISKEDLTDMLEKDCSFNGMEFEDRFIATDEEIWRKIEFICGATNIADFQKLEKDEQLRVAKLLLNDDIPARRINRLIGVTRYMIQKLCHAD